MANPRIFYDNRFSDATPVASSTDGSGNFNALNLRDWRPYTYWKAASVPANVRVDSGAGAFADYALVFGHNLKDTRSVLYFQSSSDNFVSNVVSAAFSNLLELPENFSDAYWTKTNVASTVSGISVQAPNGVRTLNALIESTANNVHEVARTTTGLSIPSSQVVKCSVYARPAGRNWIEFVNTLLDGSIVRAYFNIANGTIGSVDAGLTPSISYAGNGWYRCTIAYNWLAGGSTPVVRLRAASANGVDFYTGDGASGIYAWGFQLASNSDAYEGILNNPILFQFPSLLARYWRIEIENSVTPPFIAIAAIGSKIEFPFPPDDGFDPIARQVIGQSNRAEMGSPLGTVINFEEWRQTLNFTNIGKSFMRNTFVPAWKSALRAQPFGFAWDTDTYPGELILVQSSGSFSDPHHWGDQTDLSFEIFGVAQ
jgi:hypothetical protein